MDSQQDAIASEKSSTEFLFVVLIVAVFMALVIRYTLFSDEPIADTGFTSTAAVFTSKVAVIHAQWLMDEQPTVVALKEQQGDGFVVRAVPVNNQGWVDVRQDPKPCVRIWEQVLSMPLLIVRQPVFAVEIGQRVAGLDSGRLCRYQVSQNEYFQYNSFDGTVILSSAVRQ